MATVYLTIHIMVDMTDGDPIHLFTTKKSAIEDWAICINASNNKTFKRHVRDFLSKPDKHSLGFEELRTALAYQPFNADKIDFARFMDAFGGDIQYYTSVLTLEIN